MRRVLFLEDNNDLCKMYGQIVEHEDGIQAEFSKTPDTIRKSLNGSWDLIVADLDIPGIKTEEIIKLAKSPLVFLTGGESSAVTAAHKVYQKHNLIALLPKIFKENLK